MQLWGTTHSLLADVLFIQTYLGDDCIIDPHIFFGDEANNHQSANDA